MVRLAGSTQSPLSFTLTSIATCTTAAERSHARLIEVGVLRRKLVAVYAMSLANVVGGDANAATVILPMGYCLQVGRVNASAHAAQMINLRAFGNRPNKQRVRHAMREVAPVTAVAIRNPAISVSTLAASPNPARCGLIDFAEETLSQRPPQFGRATTERIAMSLKPRVMCFAKLATMARQRAGINQTGRLREHLGLILRGVMRPGVQAPRPPLSLPREV